MSPARHQRLMDLFDEACDRPEAEQAALLARLGEEDAELSRALAGMLRHDRAPADPLDAGALPAGSLALGAPLLSGLPDLEVLSILAEGGMGRVLLARQRSLRREVAVKVVKDEAGAPLEGLLAEAILAGSLEHPNIVPVHLLERDPEGRPLLVMKRVEGVSWAALLGDPAQAAWAQVAPGGDRLGAHLSILGSVCNALHFAHSRGVVHRDVKPENVMVGSFGEVYLLDWGIAVPALSAAQAAAQVVVGTPGFMAPEMARPGTHAIDPRTDVYLLGATLHRVLTGRPRHEGRSVAAVLEAARRPAPLVYGPEVPEELAAICRRAMHEDPGQRFASAAALREALLDYQRHQGAAALCEAAAERLQRLRAWVEAPAAGREADSVGLLGRARELLVECQFGFQESLRVWPENARARAGLRECLIVALRCELAAGNLAAARALLQQVADAPAELREEVEALRRREQERAAREARLRAIEAGQDWSVAAAPRAAALLLGAGWALLLWRLVLRAHRGAPGPMPPLLLALAMAAALLGLALLVWLFRRQLLATQVNRHGIYGLLLCMGGMVVSRALHALPAPQTAGIVSMDQVLGATVAAVGGVVLARWLWLLVPVLLSGALMARLWPAQAGLSLVLSGSAALGIGLLCLRRGPACRLCSGRRDRKNGTRSAQQSAILRAPGEVQDLTQISPEAGA